MLTPDELDKLPKNVSLLYEELEDEILSDMARRIVKTDMATETAVWQMKRLEAIGSCQEDIFKRLSKKTGKSKKELKKMFNEAVKAAYGSEAAVYEKAGQSPIPLKDNKQLQRIINSGLRKTNNLFENLTRTTAKTATGQFERALDTAYMQITSGAFDYNTAIRAAVKSLAQSGIESIRYPSGHTDKLDVAVRRAALTGVSQTCGKVSEEVADEMECDLVLVTAHFGARPEHAQWQGKVYSRSGKSRKYPDLRKATGYGTGPGLKGWNCRHDFGAYIDGVSVNPYTSERLKQMKNRTVEYNGETMSEYDASQKQRSMERKIRASKRELATLDGAIKAADNPSLKEAFQADFDRKSVTLKKQEAKLKDFTNKTILRRDRAREQVPAHFDSKSNSVVSFNKSVSQKAVWASKTAASNPRRAFDIIQVLPKEKGDTFKPENLIKDLKKSKVGQEYLEYIISENLDIQVNYNPEITEKGLMGLSYGKHIDIFALNTKTKKETVKTIIHEVTHIKYDIGGDQWAEAVCEAKAKQHEKTALTLEDKKNIIKAVKENYPDYKWRKRKNGKSK